MSKRKYSNWFFCSCLVSGVRRAACSSPSHRIWRITKGRTAVKSHTCVRCATKDLLAMQRCGIIVASTPAKSHTSKFNYAYNLIRMQHACILNVFLLLLLFINRCEQCGSAFSQAAHLKNHAKVHSGEKPFKCEICTAAFADRFALKRHRRIHEKYGEFLDLISNVFFFSRIQSL